MTFSFIILCRFIKKKVSAVLGCLFDLMCVKLGRGVQMISLKLICLFFI